MPSQISQQLRHCPSPGESWDTRGLGAFFDRFASHTPRSIIDRRVAGDGGGGGVVFGVKLEVVEKVQMMPRLDVFVEGNAASLTFCFDDGEIIVNNIHNFSLNDRHAVVREVEQTIVRAGTHKLGRSITFVGGDFNYMVQGEKASRVGINGATLPFVGDSGSYVARGRGREPALKHCVVFFQGEFSRLGKASKGKGDHCDVAARLDRVYSLLLPLQHTLVNAKTSVI